MKIKHPLKQWSETISSSACMHTHTHTHTRTHIHTHTDGDVSPYDSNGDMAVEKRADGKLYLIDSDLDLDLDDQGTMIILQSVTVLT